MSSFAILDRMIVTPALTVPTRTRMGLQIEYQEGYRSGFEIAYSDGYFGRTYSTAIPANLGRVVTAKLNASLSPSGSRQ